jgi:polyvinyl alcohol dehydrogenase (cytochrome)
MSDMTAAPLWSGWGSGPTNTRFQNGGPAGLTGQDVPRLTLKWAFGFPDTAQAWSQPAVAGGRLFVGSQAGVVYALDATSGCILWTFVASSGVRTGIVIDQRPGAGLGPRLYFSDMAGFTYAIDAVTGSALWKQQVETHRFVRLTGTPTLYGNRLFVPVSSFEEGMAPEVEDCCTFRGSVVALDTLSGTIVWKTYTIEKEAVRQGPTIKGQPNWGPSGGAVWASPTVDAARGALYVSTGNNYTPPATSGTDSILALDLKTGDKRWSVQLTEKDVWNTTPAARDQSPDFDFGSSVILTKTAEGRDILVAPQKSGIAWGLDPDKRGAIIWQYRAGKGGSFGGIEWGGAADGRRVFLAVSDVNWPDPGGLHAVDLHSGLRRWFVPPPPAKCETISRSCNGGQPGAVTAIPGAIFSGALDGMMRAYSTEDGKLLWEFDTNRPFKTLNDTAANGGSINGPGPTVAGRMVYVSSGYGLNGKPGNVLLAFGVD